MIDRLQQWREILLSNLDKLSERERKLVLLLLAVCGGLVVVFGLQGMSQLLTEESPNTTEAYRQEIRQIQSLRGTYAQAQKQNSKRTRQLRKSNVSLFSFLPTVASQLGLTLNDLEEKKQPVPGKKLLQSNVSLTLKKLSIDKLTAFLKAVEDSGPTELIKIIRLKITKRMDDDLDAQMTVATWRRS